MNAAVETVDIDFDDRAQPDHAAPKLKGRSEIGDDHNRRRIGGCSIGPAHRGVTPSAMLLSALVMALVLACGTDTDEDQDAAVEPAREDIAADPGVTHDADLRPDAVPDAAAPVEVGSVSDARFDVIGDAASDARPDSPRDARPGAADARGDVEHSADAAFVGECDPAIGATAPLPVCSAADPCLAPSPTARVDQIAGPPPPPACRTTQEDRPDSAYAHNDGPPLVWTDEDGIDRHTCEYRPPGTGPGAPRPLLLFFHGAGGEADNVYNFTSLRSKAPTFDLTGDPARPGFVLVSVQGRNLHWPTSDPRDWVHFDHYHRSLGAPSTNRDISFTDTLVDRLVAEGAVDEDRIYTVGWSNGGLFAQMYAIARHDQPTPAGHRVAAGVAFTAADPFHMPRQEAPQCQLDPYPRSQVPLFLVSRACDFIACDARQWDSLLAQGLTLAPGAVMQTWFDDLAQRMGNNASSWRIVSAFGQTVERCTGPALCTSAVALLNHVRWPDGVADNSGIDHEPDMLTFMRDHPRR